MKYQRYAVTAVCIGIALCCGVVFSGCGGGGGREAPPETLVQRQVREACASWGLPALGAAMTDSAGAGEHAVSGVRKIGSSRAVREDDLFCLGSCAKAMTATMVATLVDDGLLAWDTQVTEVMPDVAATMDPRNANIALHHLLSHHSGLLAFHDEEVVDIPPDLTGDVVDQRRTATQWVFSQPPLTAIDTYDYSNAGYVVVAAMAEAVTGKSYEMLMEERLFAPLGITAIAGLPAVQQPNQPWGHIWTGSRFEPYDGAYLEIFLPAGGYSLSIGDFVTFARMHLRGLRGEDTLLRPDTLARMHTPAYADGSDYGYGWMITPDGAASFHGGFTTDGFEAFMVISPDRDRAGVFATNSCLYPEDPEQLTPFYAAIDELLTAWVTTGEERRVSRLRMPRW